MWFGTLRGYRITNHSVMCDSALLRYFFPQGILKDFLKGWGCAFQWILDRSRDLCRITCDLADLALRKSDLARCKCYRITPFECRITPRGVIWHSLGSDLALPGEWFGTMCNELGILPNHCDLAIPKEWFGNIWSDLATKNLTESLILEWFGMPNHSFWSDLAFFNAESHNHSVIWQGGG